MIVKSKSTLLYLYASIIILFISAFTIIDTHTPLHNLSQNGPWVAPEAAKKLKDPTPNDKNAIKRGKALYKTRCVVCHGESGTGDGPGSKALNPKPADHTSVKVQQQTDGEIFWKISEGRGNMIGWKLIIPEKDRWDLVNYIRTLKK